LSNDEPLRTSVAADLGSLASEFAASAAPTPLGAGSVVGEHFELEAALGRGGMGEVYRALDRRLARRVAIKIGLRGADVARARREAVALAQLAHPNVVTIHEVGEHAGVPFVAMELCEGGTASTWLRARPRGWREIVALYVAAGRGLAAAHAAGLVHRDVKPDNILISGDGRPRIGDFGLARAAGLAVDGRDAITVDLGPREVDPDAPTLSSEDAAATPRAPATPRGPTPSPSDDVTAAGAIVGTPRYMAPEQAAGATLDARTDQFALCVALYEALAGVTPFPFTPDARAAAIAAGRLAPPRTRVPRRVLAIVARGLAARPDDRWPALPALLDALERAARRRWWLAAAPALAVAAGVAWWAWPTPAPPPGCSPVAAQVEAVWPQAKRQAALTRGPEGAGLVAAVDRRVAEWRDLRGTTCRELRAGGARAAAVLSTMICLDQRLAELGSALGGAAAITDSDRTESVEGLAPTALCADGPRHLQREPQPAAPALARRVAADRVRLNEVARLTRLGRFDEATAALERLEAVAEYPPLAAEAAYQRADLLGEQTQYAASKSAYREALNLAASSHHLVVQVQALLDLAFTLVEDVDNFDERARGEIDAMLGLAEGTLRGMVPDLDLQRHLVGNRAWIRQQLGDLPGAIADAREAVRLAEREPGPASGEALAASHVLAGALYAADRFAEADEVATAALAAAAGRWPDRHDSVRLLIELNAAIAMSRNRPAAAAALATRALAAVSAVFGPRSREAFNARMTLAVTEVASGRADDAAATLAGLLADLAREDLAQSTTAAMAHANRALALSLAGRYVEAAVDSAAAVAAFERIFGPAHPNLIDALCNQALTALDVGQPRDGEAPARRAYQIALTHLGPDEPGLANPLATLAIVLAVNRHGPEAGRLAQRAIALAGPGDDRAAVRGEAELALAMAQVQAGDLVRGRATGQAALATLTRAGDAAAPDLRRARAWLATLPPR